MALRVKPGNLSKLRIQYKAKDHDPDMDKVVSFIEESGFTMKEVSETCGVAQTTMRNWQRHKTKRPQHNTMRYALRAIGYGFEIVKTKKRTF